MIFSFIGLLYSVIFSVCGEYSLKLFLNYKWFEISKSLKGKVIFMYLESKLMPHA